MDTALNPQLPKNEHAMNSNSNLNTNSNLIANNKLKLLQFNIAKNHTNFQSLAPELASPGQNVVLVINESTYLQDLTRFNLVGVRHQDRIMSGLCVFISDHLRPYTELKTCKWGFYLTINPPSDANGNGFIPISIIATYRNPVLDKPEYFNSANDEYFDEIFNEGKELLKKSSLIYMLGDMNCFNQRYEKTDWSVKGATDFNGYQVKSYMKMIRSFPASYKFMHTGITHIPRANTSRTCAQLDYIVSIFNQGRCPSGKSKVFRGTTSDHFCISVLINIPRFTFFVPKFETRYRSVDTDYALADLTLAKIRRKWPLRSAHIEQDFLTHENTKSFLLNSTTRNIKRVMPVGAYHPTLVRAQILQQKAHSAYMSGDVELFNNYELKIRETMSRYYNDIAKKASRDRQAPLFYDWCRFMSKPTKAQSGKYVMRNDSVETIAEEINKNYRNHAADDSWRIRQPTSWDDIEEVHKKIREFDFVEATKKAKKTPLQFKRMPVSESHLAKQLTMAIVENQVYPPVLKASDCSLLPSRSIFSSATPINKVVEAFFNSLISIEDSENVAYRKNLSCTSLLLQQFDVFATEQTIFTLNCDYKKAFDTVSRSSIIGTIDNKVVANILSTWMSRRLAGYSINWRGNKAYIKREDWTAGVEPGSICGPKLFIKGLQCSKVFNQAIQKNYFSDDSFPMFKNLLELKQDAVGLFYHAEELKMKLHTTGDKRCSFMAFGQIDDNAIGQKIEILVNGRKVEIQRDFKVRQLGLVYSASQEGILSIDLEHVIDRVRSASFSLQSAALNCPASVLITNVMMFVVPAISYAIAVWYPIEAADKKSDQLRRLRYWYNCCLNICCFENRSLMGWSNSSKTLTSGTNTEMQLTHLTGLPTIEIIYQSSILSHYPHIQKHYTLGWLDKTIKFHARTKRFHYIKTEVKNRISPLRLTLNVVNSIKSHNLVSVRKALKLNSELKIIEQLYGKDYPPWKIRIFQRVLSLHLFGKLDDSHIKRNLDKDTLAFADNSDQRELVRKRVCVVKRSISDRPLVLEQIFGSH